MLQGLSSSSNIMQDSTSPGKGNSPRNSPRLLNRAALSASLTGNRGSSSPPDIRRRRATSLNIDVQDNPEARPKTPGAGILERTSSLKVRKSPRVKKTLSIDASDFGRDSTRLYVHQIRRTISRESVGSDGSDGSDTHLQPILKTRSGSSDTISPIQSPLLSNRRQSIFVNKELSSGQKQGDEHEVFQTPKIGLLEINHEKSRERPTSAYQKTKRPVVKSFSVNDKDYRKKLEEKRNTMKFHDWLAEKKALERYEIERHRTYEVANVIETERVLRDKISHGTSFDDWLERKQETRKVEDECGIQESRPDSEKTASRKLEAEKKYNEWLKKKFQQEMQREKELIEEQSLRLKKLKEKNKAKNKNDCD